MQHNVSTPPPAKIADIIHDLFQNEKIKKPDGSRVYFTVSRVKLWDKQKNSLNYPLGVEPLGLYVLMQTDTYDAEKKLLSTLINLVSFAKKDDGYIYGYYFVVENQDRFKSSVLMESCKPVKLSHEANIINDNYVEVYNDVLGTTVILGLQSGDKPYASLQYSNKSRYFYEALEENGIKDPNYPETFLLEVSKNLCV